MASRGSVLIVDDDPDIRAAFEQILEYEGYEIAHASNGKDALEYLESHRPDVILLDLMMPEMNGYEFERAIRNNPMLNKIPLVVMSASTIKNPNLKDTTYLRKPIQLHGLLKAVGQFVP